MIIHTYTQKVTPSEPRQKRASPRVTKNSVAWNLLFTVTRWREKQIGTLEEGMDQSEF